ncbi:hypothetical protein ACFVHB_37995 [Kitasatospora sp. NPDC127111]|uniref:hypothetical protein n=1 Tax=Kitasatospora sp. NPDC127111 TaxID=3345363 RepID=UPI00362D8506
MSERTAGAQGVRVSPEGRMTEQDAETFRVLLERLEQSLEADRAVSPARGTVGAAGSDG